HPRSYSEHAFRSDGRLLCPHGLRYKSLCVFCHQHEEKSKGLGKRDSHRRWSPSSSISSSPLGSDKKNSVVTSNKKLWNALGGNVATGVFSTGGGWGATGGTATVGGGGGRPGGCGIGRDGDRPPISQQHQRSRRNSFGSVSRLSCGTAATTVSNASTHHSRDRLDNSADHLQTRGDTRSPLLRGRSRGPRRNLDGSSPMDADDVYSEGYLSQSSPYPSRLHTQSPPPVFIRLWENAMKKQQRDKISKEPALFQPIFSSQSSYGGYSYLRSSVNSLDSYSQSRSSLNRNPKKAWMYGSCGKERGRERGGMNRSASGGVTGGEGKATTSHEGCSIMSSKKSKIAINKGPAAAAGGARRCFSDGPSTSSGCLGNSQDRSMASRHNSNSSSSSSHGYENTSLWKSGEGPKKKLLYSSPLSNDQGLSSMDSTAATPKVEASTSSSSSSSSSSSQSSSSLSMKSQQQRSLSEGVAFEGRYRQQDRGAEEEEEGLNMLGENERSWKGSYEDLATEDERRRYLPPSLHSYPNEVTPSSSSSSTSVYHSYQQVIPLNDCLIPSCENDREMKGERPVLQGDQNHKRAVMFENSMTKNGKLSEGYPLYSTSHQGDGGEGPGEPSQKVPTMATSSSSYLQGQHFLQVNAASPQVIFPSNHPPHHQGEMTHVYPGGVHTPQSSPPPPPPLGSDNGNYREDEMRGTGESEGNPQWFLRQSPQSSSQGLGNLYQKNSSQGQIFSSSSVNCSLLHDPSRTNHTRAPDMLQPSETPSFGSRGGYLSSSFQPYNNNGGVYTPYPSQLHDHEKNRTHRSDSHSSYSHSPYSPDPTGQMQITQHQQHPHRSSPNHYEGGGGVSPMSFPSQEGDTSSMVGGVVSTSMENHREDLGENNTVNSSCSSSSSVSSSHQQYMNPLTMQIPSFTLSNLQIYSRPILQPEKKVTTSLSSSDQNNKKSLSSHSRRTSSSSSASKLFYPSLSNGERSHEGILQGKDPRKGGGRKDRFPLPPSVTPLDKNLSSSPSPSSGILRRRRGQTPPGGGAVPSRPSLTGARSLGGGARPSGGGATPSMSEKKMKSCEQPTPQQQQLGRGTEQDRKDGETGEERGVYGNEFDKKKDPKGLGGESPYYHHEENSSFSLDPSQENSSHYKSQQQWQTAWERQKAQWRITENRHAPPQRGKEDVRGNDLSSHGYQPYSHLSGRDAMASSHPSSLQYTNHHTRATGITQEGGGIGMKESMSLPLQHGEKMALSRQTPEEGGAIEKKTRGGGGGGGHREDGMGRENPQHQEKLPLSCLSFSSPQHSLPLYSNESNSPSPSPSQMTSFSTPYQGVDPDMIGKGREEMNGKQQTSLVYFNHIMGHPHHLHPQGHSISFSGGAAPPGDPLQSSSMNTGGGIPHNQPPLQQSIYQHPGGTSPSGRTHIQNPGVHTPQQLLLVQQHPYQQKQQVGILSIPNQAAGGVSMIPQQGQGSSHFSPFQPQQYHDQTSLHPSSCIPPSSSSSSTSLPLEEEAAVAQRPIGLDDQTLGEEGHIQPLPRFPRPSSSGSSPSFSEREKRSPLYSTSPSLQSSLGEGQGWPEAAAAVALCVNEEAAALGLRDRGGVTYVRSSSSHHSALPLHPSYNQGGISKGSSSPNISRGLYMRQVGCGDMMLPSTGGGGGACLSQHSPLNQDHLHPNINQSHATSSALPSSSSPGVSFPRPLPLFFNYQQHVEGGSRRGGSEISGSGTSVSGGRAAILGPQFSRTRKLTKGGDDTSAAGGGRRRRSTSNESSHSITTSSSSTGGGVRGFFFGAFGSSGSSNSGNGVSHPN
ncbi:hypothetical protein CSUI_010775, partial [Cystoisospora suis]